MPVIFYKTNLLNASFTKYYNIKRSLIVLKGWDHVKNVIEYNTAAAIQYVCQNENEMKLCGMKIGTRRLF